MLLAVALMIGVGSTLAIPAGAMPWAVADKALDEAIASLEPLELLGLASSEASAEDAIYTRAYDIPFAPGQTARLYEHYTLDAFVRHPRRAILLLTTFTASSWEIPVEGYNAVAILARNDFFVYTLDPLGLGNSWRPDDGLRITFGENVTAARSALGFLRQLRHIPHVDLLGEGYGAAVATQLAADAGRVRSCIMTANVYKEQVAGPATDPNFIAMLLASPDGYIFIPPFIVDTLTVGAPPAAREYFAATQSTFFPVPSFTVTFVLPFFDPSVARVPGLIIHGENDPFPGPHDPQDLAADYGKKGAELVVIEDAGRGVRFEGPEGAAAFWAEVLDFLER